MIRSKHDKLVSRLPHDPWSVTHAHTKTHTHKIGHKFCVIERKKAWFFCLHWPQCDPTGSVSQMSSICDTEVMSFTVYHWLIRGLCICSLTWHWSNGPVCWSWPASEHIRYWTVPSVTSFFHPFDPFPLFGSEALMFELAVYEAASKAITLYETFPLKMERHQIHCSVCPNSWVI